MRFKFGPIDFTQPSTWRGAAGIAAVFGISFSPELTEQIAITLGAGLSAIEIFRNEYARRKEPLPRELEPFAEAASVLRKIRQGQPTTAKIAAVASLAADAIARRDLRVRQPVPTEPETTRNPESPGFGDR